MVIFGYLHESRKLEASYKDNHSTKPFGGLGLRVAESWSP